MSNTPEDRSSTRREFIRNAAATAAVSAGVASVARSEVYSLAPGRVLGANDRINIGHVGLGVQGWGAHCRMFHDNAADYNSKQVAVSDLYVRRMRRASDTIGGVAESNWHQDYRKLLERKDV